MLKNLLLKVMYRQPDNAFDGNRSTSREFRQALDEIRTTLAAMPLPAPDMGILTCPTSIGGISSDQCNVAKDFEDLGNEHFLFQQIHKPTHRLRNILDLCFFNNPAFNHSYQCSATIFTYHYILQGCTIRGTVPREDCRLGRPGERS